MTTQPNDEPEGYKHSWNYTDADLCKEDGGHSYAKITDAVYGTTYICRFCGDEKYESEKVRI